VQDYNRKIKKYIEERKNSWQTIVTKIEVVFPFGEEMRGIEIIDSPGFVHEVGLLKLHHSILKTPMQLYF
jgi:hypothetical protein